MADGHRAGLSAAALAPAVLAAALAGCASQDPGGAPKLHVVGASSAGGLARLAQDELLAVELTARPSAGFTWEVASIDGSMLALAGREHVSAPALGGWDQERLLFKGVREGRVSLVLAYHRPWEEPSAGDPTYAIEVDVPGPYAGSYAAPAPVSAAQSALLSASSTPATLNLCDPGDGSYSKCTPIKNQGQCGGCWAFATVGVFENLLYRASPSAPPSLSEQYLISCNSNRWTCAQGGSVAFGYYINKYLSPPESAAGAVYTADFPFKAADVGCGSAPHPHHEKLSGFTSLGSGLASVDAIKQALTTYGPVWTAVCADSAFTNYKYSGASSIFRGSCTTLNHAVVLVGWNDNGGDGYWFLRNSWGSHWGDKGYMRIAYGANKVGSDSYSASYASSSPLATNVPPIADAGKAQTVKSGTAVALDGSLSSDPDGAIAKLAWAQTGGSPTVALSSASAAKPTFTAPSVDASTDLTFTLTVTDNSGASASASVVVTVTGQSVPPVADAGRAQTVAEGARVVLDGSASYDSGGAIAAFAWAQVAAAGVPSVTLSGAASSQASFVAPLLPQGSALVALTFELTVTDDSGASATDSVVVRVAHVDAPPVAEAGPSQTVAEGAAVALDGSASSDSDGVIAAYSWVQTAGPSVSLAGASTARPTFTAPSAGNAQLTFELTVTDDAGAASSASVSIAVAPASAAVGPAGGASATVNPFAAGCSSSGMPALGLWAVPFALGLLARSARSLSARRRR